jgi:predicted RNA-binding Zn-ribbon protein involved in translation (DUF1610 family)
MSTTDDTATRRCPDCDQEIEADSESCPACGTLFVSGTCRRHPDRVAAGACIVCGQPVCEECDDDEPGHHVCPEHAGIPIIEGWAQIYSTSGELEAQLIRDNLAAEGIDAEVLSQRDSALAFDLGEFTQVRVLVPAFAYQDARRILDAHMDADGAVAFACPSCGETYQPGDVTCRACGADLPRPSA